MSLWSMSEFTRCAVPCNAVGDSYFLAILLVLIRHIMSHKSYRIVQSLQCSITFRTRQRCAHSPRLQYGESWNLTDHRWVSVGSKCLLTLESLRIAACDVLFDPSQRPAGNCPHDTENSSKELPHHRESDSNAERNDKLDPL